jgi:uncharacterized protein (DUF433 family)
MDFPGFLTSNPDGSIRITGHRIGLEHILFHHNRGSNAEQIAAFFPTLSRELIAQVVHFYQSNLAEIDCYLKKVESDLDRQKREAGPGITLQELKNRMKTRLQETA